MSTNEVRRLSIMVDYHFGGRASRALPKSGLKFVYSRRSGRPKLVLHDGKLFATIRPNGAMAVSLYGASILSRSRGFRENCVKIHGDAVPFVVGGLSVFCKFVHSAGGKVHPRGEVGIIDREGRLIGVGTAVLNGKHMVGFKSGVAVKVRDGLGK